MDLSVKRMKTTDSSNNRSGQQRSHSVSMKPVTHTNSMMPQLIKSEVIKKEVMETGDNDHMSEKSDDSSDSGRLQMDISSQEDTEEYRNLPVLKPIGRDTPESNFSDEHAFESADHLWQALAQHSQCKSIQRSIDSVNNWNSLFSEWRKRSHSTSSQDDQLPIAGNSILTTTPLADHSRSTDGSSQGWCRFVFTLPAHYTIFLLF